MKTTQKTTTTKWMSLAMAAALVPVGVAAFGQATEPTTEPAAPQQVEGRGEMRSVTYLGVGTQPVPREVAGHLDLPEGVGLLVVDVVPQTPAEDAGLQRNDILRKLDDQWVVNQEQLGVLVRMREPGEEVTLEVIRKGQVEQVPVTLGERQMREPMRLRVLGQGEGGEFRVRPVEGPQVERLRAMEQALQQMRMQFGDNHPQRQELEAQLHAARQQLRAQMEALRAEQGEMPQMFFFGGQDPMDGQAPQFDFDRRGSVTVTDVNDAGRATLTVRGGEKTFHYVPTDGEAWEGPVNSPEQRAALTDEQRARLEKLEGMLPGPVSPTPPQGQDARPDQQRSLQST